MNAARSPHWSATELFVVHGGDALRSTACATSTRIILIGRNECESPTSEAEPERRRTGHLQEEVELDVPRAAEDVAPQYRYDCQRIDVDADEVERSAMVFGRAAGRAVRPLPSRANPPAAYGLSSIAHLPFTVTLSFSPFLSTSSLLSRSGSSAVESAAALRTCSPFTERITSPA
jgi:hypothetical protein